MCLCLQYVCKFGYEQVMVVARNGCRMPFKRVLTALGTRVVVLPLHYTLNDSGQCCSVALWDVSCTHSHISQFTRHTGLDSDTTNAGRTAESDGSELLDDLGLGHNRQYDGRPLTVKTLAVCCAG